MLNEIREFFKREKGYAYLLTVLCLIYGGLIFFQRNIEKPSANTEILEKFKKAENQVQAKIKDLGSVNAYLEDRPDLALWANLFSLFAIAALIAGVILDYLLLTRPLFRLQFYRARPPSEFTWHFSFLFKFFIWFFTANIGIALVLGGIRHFSGGPENLFLLLHTNAAEIASFLVILWLVRCFGGKLSDLGFTVPDGKWFREIRMGWSAYLAALPFFAAVLFLLLLITKFFNYDPPPHPLVPMFLEEGSQSHAFLFYSLLLAAVAGPVFEEIFFRGFCYPILKKRFGGLASMVITSSFFAFIHDSTFAFWPIFILGMTLNYVYEKRGSLIANITIHITHNLLFLGYFFLAKDIISREMGG